VVIAVKKQHISPIGTMLRYRRKELKMTLQSLAKESGLSAPFLSQAERNKTVPSIVSLTKLAKALKVELKYFMEIPHDDSIVHRGANLPIIDIDSPVTYFNMTSSLTNPQMNGMIMSIPSGHRFPMDQRSGEDFLYVLQGELFAVVGDVSTTLCVGDSMHFDSAVPHTAFNDSSSEVLLLYVGTPCFF
jgi:transcriptional regulator with XRE-family HTH domain